MLFLGKTLGSEIEIYRAGKVGEFCWCLKKKIIYILLYFLFLSINFEILKEVFEIFKEIGKYKDKWFGKFLNINCVISCRSR